MPLLGKVGFCATDLSHRIGPTSVPNGISLVKVGYLKADLDRFCHRPCPLQIQRVGVLDFGHYEGGEDGAYGVDVSQDIDNEFVVVGHVRGLDF